MRHRATAALLIACVIATTGCSHDKSGVRAANTGTAVEPIGNQSPLTGLSALQVWEKTKADADAAGSVHIAAHLLDGEQKMTMNLKMTDAGKVFGFIQVRGQKVMVRRLGRTLYLKAQRGFWTTTGDAGLAPELAGRWIKVRQGFAPDLEEFFQLTDMDFVVADLMSLSAAEQTALKLVPGIDVGRNKTVGLAGESLSAEAQFQTLYVSATEPCLPLDFSIGSDQTQYMRFRGWDEDFTVVRPKGALDLAKVG
jgi:hypothetical protein